MERENEILTELKLLGSPLAGLSRVVPFAVPAGFFDSLEQKIITGITASESEDAILSFPKAMPYTIPQDYFEDSAAQIIATAAISSSDKAVFEVPAGYFDVLPDKIMAAVHAENEPAKKPKKIAFIPVRRVVQWAVAAMLVLGIGIGSYSIYNTPDRKAASQLASVDGDDITDYVAQNVDAAPDAVAMNTPAASAVKTLSKEDIANYLDDTGWEDASADD